jgi:organic hydroperoxide reductase OsmC/OhrA
MSEHVATVRWTLTNAGDDFLARRYSRVHTWTFDGGVTIPASPSPSVVPAPYSNAAAVDPEEAFVAAVSSCHMLQYLFLAAQAGFLVHSYEDTAVGTMTKNEHGVPWVSTVTLAPRIVYDTANSPSVEEEDRLHHEAHETCFIANSIKTNVVVTRGEADGHS